MNVCSLLHIKTQILLYCNVGRKNKLCICTGRKPNHRRYRRALYFLTTTPYSTTFCRKTWHNRAAEAAHAVTFDFSSGFYNRFPITGCRIRRFLCQNTSSEGFEPPKQLSSTSLVVFFMLHLSFIQRPASRDVNCGAYLKTVKNSRKRPVIQARPRLAKKKFPVRSQKGDLPGITSSLSDLNQAGQSFAVNQRWPVQ